MEKNRSRVSCSFVIILGIAALLLAAAGIAALRMLDRSAPSVTVRPGVKAIGRETTMTIEASEPKNGIRRLRAVLVQGGAELPVADMAHPAQRWWSLWRKEIRSSVRIEAAIGAGKVAGLKEGEATLRIEATNDSHARFGKGRTTVHEVRLPVLLTPPRIEALSTQHYINQGGSECVLYRVSSTAEESGVRAGDYFFRGYPKPGGPPGEMFAFFAFPYDLPLSTPITLAARDAAGNESVARFTCKLFPKRFPTETVELTDSFLGRVVPEIVSRSPSIKGQGDLLKDFLAVNGALRSENAATLRELATKTAQRPLWHGPFTQLGSSQVMAPFAEYRTYKYGGRAVDRQVHLGYDLAVTANHPIGASNDGVVALAGYFGIYGNSVLLDHGCGLMTLYSHLSSIGVTEGKAVRRGDVLGRSGSTGMAGGDHLHFAVLLQGIPVMPTEWWDPHWIEDRVESKLGPA